MFETAPGIATSAKPINLLLVPASYPHAAARWAGAMNERSAAALREIVGHVEVLVPRPYAPRWLTVSNRWKAYAIAPAQELRDGIAVHRPAYPLIPRLRRSFWPSVAAYIFSRTLVRRLHRTLAFDAILSFDLAIAGGLAWRLAKDLHIPACGWATGSDIRWGAATDVGRRVRETLRQLDLVFYQTPELKMLGAQLLGVSAETLSDEHHIVQARGVAEARQYQTHADIRREVRTKLEVRDDDVVVLYLGRMAQAKGVFDLVDGFARWARERPRLVLVLVGARPGHDETPALQQKISALEAVKERIKLVEGCPPDAVWSYFKAADVYAFPSYREGMPNSLLEAMVSGLPAVAFSIPPVQEITRFGPGLVAVPPYDFAAFGERLLRFVSEPDLRREFGDRARIIAREHFSVDANMRLAVDHIRRVIRERGGR